jgi:hypothetical protein
MTAQRPGQDPDRMGQRRRKIWSKFLRHHQMGLGQSGQQGKSASQTMFGNRNKRDRGRSHFIHG